MNKLIECLTLIRTDDIDVYDNGDITVSIERDPSVGGTVRLYTTIEKLEKLVKEAKQAIQENKE